MNANTSKSAHPPAIELARGRSAKSILASIRRSSRARISRSPSGENGAVDDDGNEDDEEEEEEEEKAATRKADAGIGISAAAAAFGKEK